MEDILTCGAEGAIDRHGPFFLKAISSFALDSPKVSDTDHNLEQRLCLESKMLKFVQRTTHMHDQSCRYQSFVPNDG